MDKLEDIVAYLAENYPHKSELSKARITKLVYLADWQAVKFGRDQITNINWYFHNFGPYVEDVVDAARRNDRTRVIMTQNAYGDLKEQVQYIGPGGEFRSLSDYTKFCLDTVIGNTRSLYWHDFIKHVYATPPVAKSQRYRFLDLKSFV